MNESVNARIADVNWRLPLEWFFSLLMNHIINNLITSTVRSFRENTHFFTEKSLSQPQKRILVSWYHKLLGRSFSDFCGEMSTHIEKTESASKYLETKGLSVKENTNASEYTAQNNSIFAFAFDNISSPSSFWDLQMNFSSLLNV